MSRSTIAAGLGALLWIAACGGGGGAADDAVDHDGAVGAVDGPSGPDAQTRVTVSGLAQTAQGTSIVALPGATIEVFPRAGGAALATATSGADGAYSMMLETGGAPLDVYFRGRSNGRLDTYLYPPRPVTADTTGVTLLIMNQQTLSTLTSLGGATYDPSKGFVALIAADAAGTPLAGATATISPAGSADIMYAAGGFPSGSASATDASGTVFIANTSTGQVTVDGTAGATAFAAVTFEARAGAMTNTLLLP